MRDISEELQIALTDGHVQPAILAEFDFDSGTIGMWSGYGPLTWGDRLFVGGGELISLSNPQETQDLQAAGLVFSLSGVSTANIAIALQENLQGRPCRVYLAAVLTKAALALEEEEALIVLEDGGRILLENQITQDPYQMFAGLMDVIEGTIEVPTSMLKLSAENALVMLRRPNMRRYTDEDQQDEYPGDLFFQFIATLQDKTIAW